RAEAIAKATTTTPRPHPRTTRPRRPGRTRPPHQQPNNFRLHHCRRSHRARPPGRILDHQQRTPPWMGANVSLAKAVSKRITPAAQKQVRVLTLDIERLPGVATVQHRGLTVTGECWDLGGWKHVIGRRIHADDVMVWPATICAAAKWYDERQVMFTAQWLDGGVEGFL